MIGQEEQLEHGSKQSSAAPFLESTEWIRVEGEGGVTWADAAERLRQDEDSNKARVWGTSVQRQLRFYSAMFDYKKQSLLRKEGCLLTTLLPGFPATTASF